MYRKPSSRARTARLALTYSFMTIAVLTIVSFLVLTILSYRFDVSTGTLEQRGLLQFASTPSGARITIDGRQISARTPTKHLVDPGMHDFTIERDGYETWHKNLAIEAGTLVWLDYVRLVPRERPVEIINTYEQLDDSLAAPTMRSILLQPNRSIPSFRFVDVSGNTPQGRTIALPAAMHRNETTNTDTNRTIQHTYQMIQWDDGGRYVLVRHTYNSTTEWLILDTREPERSKNVTLEFDIPITNAEFSGTSGNVLYVMSNDSLRKLDLAAGTISRPLVNDLASFHLYDTNIVTYVSRPDPETEQRTVGLYREGDTTPQVLQTVDDPDVPVSVAMTRYLGDTYIAIAEDDTFEVYRGDFTGAADSAARLITQTLDAPIDQISFNPGNNYVFVRAGAFYASFGLEHRTYSVAELSSGRATSLHWLDSMYVWSDIGDSLRIKELDGTNEHTINPVAPGHAVTLSRNGTYLYSIGEADNGYQLQRVRMILR